MCKLYCTKTRTTISKDRLLFCRLSVAQRVFNASLCCSMHCITNCSPACLELHTRTVKQHVCMYGNKPLHVHVQATKGDQYTRWMASPLVSDRSRKAQHNYLMLAGRIITSCDLSISRFNQVSLHCWNIVTFTFGDDVAGNYTATTDELSSHL